MFHRNSITRISLSAAGLVALADLKTLASRTALVGGASFIDIFLLAPGIHCQQDASELNGGEYPTTGAMTNGYVFRVENQATVSYLQGVGEPGHLTNVSVSPPLPTKYGLFFDNFRGEPLASLFYLAGIALTVIVIALLVAIKDWWALGVLCMLAVARLLNTVVLKRRSQMGWKGAAEPDTPGDLLILLSQDRWVRMRGMVDDLKAVTAGQWLRETSDIESVAVSIATLLVFVAAALAGNASTVGSLLLACLLLMSVALLGVSNMVTTKLRMFGHMVRVDGEPTRYNRRLDMVRELIAESKRDDWAIGMGLIVPPTDKAQKVNV
ncbi:hypothetical protein FRB96_003776 [Tulasnella sp. 330]|nr:hypothetical protein FRB96_003776 [Tulasnella sp. 330]KAG8883457.1 hypothetical protein FRB97_006585 [Tulasnella sp. 331]